MWEANTYPSGSRTGRLMLILYICIKRSVLYSSSITDSLSTVAHVKEGKQKKTKEKERLAAWLKEHGGETYPAPPRHAVKFMYSS
jgi:hypothetical protein